MLQNRFRAYAAQSADPGKTLYQVKRTIHCDREAFQTLEEAMQARRAADEGRYFQLSVP